MRQRFGSWLDRAEKTARRMPLRALTAGALLAVAPCVASSQATDRELEALLDMGLDELAQVEVTTASKRPESVALAPATVRVITEEQIRERGYLTLEQALADLPGMQLRDTIGLNSYVFVRGVPNQNNLALVLIDGIQINELNSGGFYGGGQYNLSNVKRIEVVYGPTSALYGTNAVSGVINVITKDPRDAPGLRVGGAAGTYDTGRGDLQYAYWDPAARLGLRVSGMLKTTQNPDLSGARNDWMWTPDLELFERDRALDLKLAFRDFVFGANYQNRASSSATYHRSVGTSYLDHGTLWDIRFLNVYLRHRAALAEGVTAQSQAYAREATVLDDSVREITDAGQFGFYRPNYLVGAEGTIDAHVRSDLDLVGGLVVEADWLSKGYGTSQSASPDARPPRPPKPAMTANQLVSGYLQAQYAPVERVELTGGLRFDYSSAYHGVVAPRVGAVFAGREVVAKLLYGEAFRAPRPWDYTDGLGNTGLDPERMRSLEGSVAFSWRSLLRTEATVYWNRLEGVLEKESVGVDWRWVNAGHVDTLGIEAGVEARRGPLRAAASYTFTRSRDEAGYRVPEIAEHGGTLRVGWNFTGRIRAEATGQYLGARLNPKVIAATGDRRIDPAFLLGASVSFLDLDGFDLKLHGRNLLDATYYHPSNLEADRFRQAGRTVLVEGSYRF